MCEVFEILDRELSRMEIEPTLRAHIGETLRDGITRQLGGTSVYINGIDRDARDRQARILRANGATVERIAVALNCSAKTIRAALRRSE